MITIKNKVGIDITCSVCRGIFCVNTKWPYYARWTISKDGNSDKPFICPWCNTLFNFSEFNLVILNTGENLDEKVTDKTLIINFADLSSLLSQLLFKKAFQRSDRYSIGGTFSVSELQKFCNSTVSVIDRKLLRPLAKEYRMETFDLLQAAADVIKSTNDFDVVVEGERAIVVQRVTMLSANLIFKNGKYVLTVPGREHALGKEIDRIALDIMNKFFEHNLAVGD